MDIKILDSWLKEYLATSASPQKLAEYLSLCGPSVERVETVGGDFVYDIEITTNRVDTASVYGIAREASAILPRFKIDAKLKRILTQSPDYSFTKKVNYLNATVDPKLCPRFTAVLIKNVAIESSPDWVVKRLEAAGIRAINNVVDISNYVMLALGQPVHTFDYDKLSLASQGPGKIKDTKMILRESKKGEKITTLDGKTFELLGGDIIIEDGEGRLIDLAGVMGGNLSMVDDTTQNVLLFVQTYNPTNIRKTSMGLAQRTQAATIFEKGTDTELVAPAILVAIDLFKKLCKGTPEKEILDIYPSPYKPVKITVEENLIHKKLGIQISKSDVSKYLDSLDFESVWHGNKLEVTVPSFRAKDVMGEEDIVEEIARIYGYHNLPSEIMTGVVPSEPPQKDFEFELKIKNILASLGGSEVYTLSLVPKEFVGAKSLKLKNPLGADSEYLRTSLMPSLISAAKNNVGTFDYFHLFEMANIYIPRTGQLPEEKMTLAGIMVGQDYRNAKGIVESFLQKVNIDATFEAKDHEGFSASRVADIKAGGGEIGLIGVTDSNFTYYEFSLEKLMKAVKPLKFEEISKYPSQVEDLTIIFPEKTKIGDVTQVTQSMSKLINKVEFKDNYKDSNTFRISYHDPNKTLTDKDVEEIRNNIVKKLREKFGGQVKE